MLITGLLQAPAHLTASLSKIGPHCYSIIMMNEKIGNQSNNSSCNTESENKENRFLNNHDHFIPLHERLQRRIDDKEPFFSLEFFPPRTAKGIPDFYERLDRYRAGGPLFSGITWHTSADPANMDKENSSSSIAANLVKYSSLDTMLNITCGQYTKVHSYPIGMKLGAQAEKQTLDHLKQAKTIGIRTILALRGDLPKNADLNQYKYHAVDLIRWIREEFGDWFTVCCAGYPGGHPNAPSYEEDLFFLKEKVDAGANVIITQVFFECDIFEKFVDDCRRIGITVPIIPGIMPIMSYGMLKKMATISQLEIPGRILNELETIKHDDDLVQEFGKRETLKMCRRLFSNGYAKGIHIFTMNKEKPIFDILKNLGLWEADSKFCPEAGTD